MSSRTCVSALRHRRVVAALAAVLIAPAAFGDEPPPAPPGEPPAAMEHISILGERSTLELLPGSGQLLDHEALAQFDHADVNRVLRSVPGVYLQEEDGYGLRPNIGIRGTGQDRSSRIAVLEDGVLIAPAPYSAPSAYYFPTLRRMDAIEVLKGPAAIQQGGRTTGGALNLLSTPVPDKWSGRAEVMAGSDGYGELHANAGESGQRFGWLLETVQQRADGFKELDGGGNTGFDLRDYLVKLRVGSDPAATWQQSLTIKVGNTAQEADETYVGLTDADFDATPYRRYAGSQLDQLRSRHRLYQLHYSLAGAEWEFGVTAYRDEFQRNWFKLDKINGIGLGELLGNPAAHTDEQAWLRGEADSPDGAFSLRNNNRSYVSQGMQALASRDFDTGAAEHTFTAGVRVHADEVDRFQDDDRYQMLAGDLVLSVDGAPGSQANRLSDADVRAVFLRDELHLGAWRFDLGLRFEDIELTRKDYAPDDPLRHAPTRVRVNAVSVLIPGIGATYALAPGWTALAGVYKGFNPPAPGSSSSEEESLNFEFGMRHRGDAWNTELIAFVNDYENLVGTCTASSGGVCDIGDQFDGGAARVEGLEFRAEYLYEFAADGGWQLPVALTLTHTAKAEFESAFESGFDPWGDVVAGDELPYVPENQAQLLVGVQEAGFGMTASLTYVDAMRTVAGQGALLDDASTDSSAIVDLAAHFSLNDRIELFTRVDNLFDATDVVARRPAGVRPNKPRTLLAGFRAAW